MISDAQAVEMLAIEIVDDRRPLAGTIPYKFVPIAERYQELTGRELAPGSKIASAVLHRASEIHNADAAEMTALAAAMEPEWSQHPNLSADEMAELIGRPEIERRLAKARRVGHLI